MPAKRIKNGKRKFVRNGSGHLLPATGRMFLPDHLEQVRAIAMRGITEEQMCEVFDIDEKQMGLWKAQYPTFKEALESGYTDADTEVLGALFKVATGYEHPETKVMMWDGELLTHDITKHYKPDVQAIKLWMTNRQREHWSDRKEMEHGGRADAPIGIRDETKLEVMHSILALIQPKPDNVTIDGRTGKVEE